jgi:hypothetical protein
MSADQRRNENSRNTKVCNLREAYISEFYSVIIVIKIMIMSHSKVIIVKYRNIRLVGRVTGMGNPYRGFMGKRCKKASTWKTEKEVGS